MKQLSLYTILGFAAFLARGAAADEPSQWTPPNLGKNNFPRGDPDGSKRAARAALLAAEFEDHRSAGRINGIRRWDLSALNGNNYVTSVKSQGSCGSCVAYAAIAALEATVSYRGRTHIPPDFAGEPDLAERHLYYCLGQNKCDSGWFVDEAANVAAQQGVFAEQCLPEAEGPGCGVLKCPAASNLIRNGTGSLQSVTLNSWEAVRTHIFNHGAVLTGYTVYDDFPGFGNVSASFNSSYVYPGPRKGAKVLGGHAVMCYGFDDDAPNGGLTATSKGVLSCKNSWGTWWGNGGHFKIAYGAGGIMSGEGDTMGFIWTPIDARIDPPASTTTIPAPRRTTTRRRTTTVKRTPAPTARYGLVAGACQGAMIRPSCRSYPGTYLSITSGFYGRDVVGRTAGFSGGCKAPGSPFISSRTCGGLRTAKFKPCDGYTSCEGMVGDRAFGSSGCAANIWKLARVKYDCLPEALLRRRGTVPRAGTKTL
ncbi:hypothetical protein DFJ74DRAFT_701551 [Hyaloraphidium curvatum]|nr:hypothetical protein DFJ74DRAFT_701551 [Hyaloraphidium curvatum]